MSRHGAPQAPVRITTEDAGIEIELSGGQCAEIALRAYEQWQEAMKPPVFAVYDFPTWLRKVIDFEEAEPVTVRGGDDE